MRKTALILATAGALAALPAGTPGAKPPGTCDLIKNTICHYIPPSEIPPNSCDLQEAIGIRNVMACEGVEG